MKEVEYKSKNLRVVAQKDAHEVGTILKKLTESKSGELTPDVVILNAKQTTSKLHKYFEWNDTDAGIEYRKYQARLLIGSIVEVSVSEGQTKEQRSFFNVKNDAGKNVYVTLNTVLDEPDYFNQLIDDIISRHTKLNQLLETLKCKYRERNKEKNS